jgi:hypothetical protein
MNASDLRARSELAGAANPMSPVILIRKSVKLLAKLVRRPAATHAEQGSRGPSRGILFQTTSLRTAQWPQASSSDCMRIALAVAGGKGKRCVSREIEVE